MMKARMEAMKPISARRGGGRFMGGGRVGS